jgi:hypothetical protein
VDTGMSDVNSRSGVELGSSDTGGAGRIGLQAEVASAAAIKFNKIVLILAFTA